MVTIELGGIVFPERTTHQGGWYFNSLTDWYSLPESKSAVNERPQAAGAFGIGTDFSQSAVPSFLGGYLAVDRAGVVLAAEQLAAIRKGGTKQLMTVTDDVRATSRLVSVRAVRIFDSKGMPNLEFAIDTVAADPLRYGPEVSAGTGVRVSGGGLVFPLGTDPEEYWDFGADGTSGRVSITNDGTADVWPDLAAVGGLGGGFVATNVTKGETVRFERPIPVGSVVRINQRTGMASIDGQSDVSGFITERGFFSIPAGETHQIQFAALGEVTGTPQFTATLSPGYH